MARMPRVEASQTAGGTQEQFGYIEYREQDGRVWLVFPGKPADDVRGKLRSRGFKWSPTRGAWVRQLSEAARYYGRLIAQRVQAWVASHATIATATAGPMRPCALTGTRGNEHVRVNVCRYE